jgi:hypothetical protein
VVKNKEIEANAAFLETETRWFRRLLEARIELHAKGQSSQDLLATLPPPQLQGHDGPYLHCIRELELGPAERLLLILSLLPHTAPHVLDPFFIQNNALGRPFTEFGGAPTLPQGGFVPSGETAMFLLTGHDLVQRLRHAGLFSHHHVLFARNVIDLGVRPAEEPYLSAPLRLSAEYRERLLTGHDYDPPLSAEFPAQRLKTALEWEDLVLDARTREDIDDIVTWIKHERMLMDDWQLRRRILPGYRSLFYGPPGTGKTLTASLLGKMTGLLVYRIDLAQVISKYIGETEKNIANLFDQAESQKWILFFDEADSLFGKRTEANNANDRAANQNISYLLQRIEYFAGIALLATNLHSLMDAAFTRRFQSVIHFKPPDAEHRLVLWQDNFRDKPYRLAADVDLPAIAKDFEVTGGNIVNVLRYVCLKAVTRMPQEISMDDILQGLQRERHKDGKFTTLV